MTKKPTKCGSKCSKKCKSEGEVKSPENIHSMSNQEFRFPSLLSRIKTWMNKLVS